MGSFEREKIIVNDQNFYINYMLEVSMEAEDFRETVLIYINTDKREGRKMLKDSDKINVIKRELDNN
ncbi:hypothetical protein [Thermoanaerobacter wiegelii]|uniref:Uncharacterized protein n=1 Tax=Thermoanaerobacter wiegelii Rt8.B1 TaxID=697303 RepID=G2MU31_9THEO|nr:hypothetical protein [Thermoanaerobacter wiegelii]AEM79858.1 hypothetical protein Thewi_2533 [Thermoanaerobacter wiegelii Rt8.B1]